MHYRGVRATIKRINGSRSRPLRRDHRLVPGSENFWPDSFLGSTHFPIWRLEVYRRIFRSSGAAKVHKMSAMEGWRELE